MLEIPHIPSQKAIRDQLLGVGDWLGCVRVCIVGRAMMQEVRTWLRKITGRQLVLSECIIPCGARSDLFTWACKQNFNPRVSEYSKNLTVPTLMRRVNKTDLQIKSGLSTPRLVAVAGYDITEYEVDVQLHSTGTWFVWQERLPTRDDFELGCCRGKMGRKPVRVLDIRLPAPRTERNEIRTPNWLGMICPLSDKVSRVAVSKLKYQLADS